MPDPRATMDAEMSSTTSRTDERLAQMRKRFEALMANEPGAMIIFADNGQRVECMAVGSPLELPAIHEQGTKMLANMLNQAREEANAPKPGNLN